MIFFKCIRLVIVLNIFIWHFVYIEYRMCAILMTPYSDKSSSQVYAKVSPWLHFIVILKTFPGASRSLSIICIIIHDLFSSIIATYFNIIYCITGLGNSDEVPLMTRKIAVLLWSSLNPSSSYSSLSLSLFRC